jgi:hypothetical protein
VILEIVLVCAMTCTGVDTQYVDTALCRSATREAGAPGAMTVKQYALLTTELRICAAGDRVRAVYRMRPARTIRIAGGSL